MTTTHDEQVERMEDEARAEALAESRPVAGPRERPILFSANMVRAILEGRKTQTRRVVDPSLFIETTNPDRIIEQSSHEFGPAAMKFARCPYGQPGDRLWGRETWAPHADEGETFRNYQRRMAGGCGVQEPGYVRPEIFYRADGGDPFINNWRPSIHMPRWASRLTLEVTEVRVDKGMVSVDDALAEGFSSPEEFREVFEGLYGAGAIELWRWAVSFRRLP